jgi:hypothetical protein
MNLVWYVDNPYHFTDIVDTLQFLLFGSVDHNLEDDVEVRVTCCYIYFYFFCKKNSNLTRNRGTLSV